MGNPLVCADTLLIPAWNTESFAAQYSLVGLSTSGFCLWLLLCASLKKLRLNL